MIPIVPVNDRTSSDSIYRCKIVTYKLQMVEIRQTSDFADWLRKLKDEAARARINVRLRRLSLGNAGDAKPVGAGVSELRIDYGPGYRVYFVKRGDILVILLCGGDKRTQDGDIAKAKAMAEGLKNAP